MGASSLRARCCGESSSTASGPTGGTSREQRFVWSVSPSSCTRAAAEQMPAEDPSDGRGLVRKLVDRIINEWNTNELDSVFTPMAQLGPDRSSPPSSKAP